MIRIALADNYPRIREIWHFILSAKTNFEVVAKCCNGQEAIAAAPVYSPDLFIMDINMHPVNGIEATGIITGLYPDIKVIGMSIHFDAVYVKRMLAAGAHGYVTKNSSYEEVINAIMQVHAGNYYICDEVQKIMPGLLMTQR
jgi:DNA-binding NarL/FixJ family response regulator